VAVEATWPAAELRGAAEPAPGVAGVAALSSTLPPLAEMPAVEGQTLKETSPTRVTKTIAAPASRAPDAPTPTMKLSGVFDLDAA
jgi:hypothetical protein